MICQEGEIGDCFYLVFSGMMQVSVEGAGVVAHLAPGHGFGTSAAATSLWRVCVRKRDVSHLYIPLLPFLNTKESSHC